MKMSEVPLFPTTLASREVICPICREIFIEPVSLPCKHLVCLECLERTVENNTFCCPICRTWIGTFLRHAKNRNKIINHKLWEQLKTQFPKAIERKRQGYEDGISEQFREDAPRPLTTDRGAIKKDFDDLLNKLRREEERSRRAQLTASENLAQQLMAEELERERRRKAEALEIALRDSTLARRFIETENWEPEDAVADSTSNDDGTDVTNGRDSISGECRHFTPICIVPKTPPKRLPNGQLKDTKILKPKNLTRSLDRRRATKGGLNIKNKASLKVSSTNFLSISSTEPVPADTTTDNAVLNITNGPNDMIEQQRRIEQLLLQEKADKAFAIKLQRRWGSLPTKRQHSYSLRSAKKVRDESN